MTTPAFGFPAFNDAMDDDDLRGAPMHVYLCLSKRLDFITYRQVKASVLALDAKVKEVSAWRSLARLVEVGYLEQGPKEDRVNTYRLVWSLSEAAKAAKTTRTRSA